MRLVSVPVELSSPLRTSHGVHQSRLATLIEITDSRGFVGWGENVAPHGVDYVGESASESLEAMRTHCVPAITQQEVEVRDISADQWWGFHNHNFAKHAIESALWDIEAQARNMSLSQLLGASRTTITPGVVVGLFDFLDDLVAECEMRIRQGYRRLKIKIEPGRDIEVLRHVRQCVGNEIVVQADANGAYTSSDIDHLNTLANFNLQFIEQPFAPHDVDSHIALSRAGAVRVCLDESICSRTDLVTLLDLGACSVVNVKPSRVGGIGEAVAMHNLLLERGVDAWVGGMLETGIGRASCLAVAALPGFTLTPDLSASDRYFVDDVTSPFELVDGEIAVPTGAGIGVVPRRDVMEHPDTRIENVFAR